MDEQNNNTQVSIVDIEYIRQLTNEGQKQRDDLISQFRDDAIIKINEKIVNQATEGHNYVYIEGFRNLKDYQYKAMGKVFDEYRHAGYAIEIADDNNFSLHSCDFVIRW